MYPLICLLSLLWMLKIQASPVLAQTNPSLEPVSSSLEESPPESEEPPEEIQTPDELGDPSLDSESEEPADAEGEIPATDPNPLNAAGNSLDNLRGCLKSQRFSKKALAA